MKYVCCKYVAVLFELFLVKIDMNEEDNFCIEDNFYIIAMEGTFLKMCMHVVVQPVDFVVVLPHNLCLSLMPIFEDICV